MVRSDTEATTLLALCLRIGLCITLLTLPLALALHALGKLPLPGLLPGAVVALGLQLLVMWNTWAKRYRALAMSRVVQYGGGAVFAGAVRAAVGSGNNRRQACTMPGRW